MLNPSRVSQVANIVFSSPIYLVLQPKEWSRWWGKGDGCGIIKSGRRMWPKAEPLKTMALLTAWNAARSAKRDIRRRKPGRNSSITRNANASPIPMTLIRSIRVWLTAMEPILLVFVGKILNNCISGYTVAHYGVKSSMRRYSVISSIFYGVYSLGTVNGTYILISIWFLIAAARPLPPLWRLFKGCECLWDPRGSDRF